MNGRCITAAGAARGERGGRTDGRRASNRTCRAISSRDRHFCGIGDREVQNQAGIRRVSGQKAKRVPHGTDNAMGSRAPRAPRAAETLGLLDNELNARGLMSVHAPSRDKRTRRFVWGESISAAATAAADVARAALSR